MSGVATQGGGDVGFASQSDHTDDQIARGSMISPSRCAPGTGVHRRTGSPKTRHQRRVRYLEIASRTREDAGGSALGTLNTAEVEFLSQPRTAQLALCTAGTPHVAPRFDYGRALVMADRASVKVPFANSAVALCVCTADHPYSFATIGARPTSPTAGATWSADVRSLRGR